MDQEQSRFLDPQSPYTLFLILILLILSSEKDLESHLEQARTFILETKRSLESIRGGFDIMQANLMSFRTHLMSIDK
ncbi:hypothetical protein [Desulforamulus reducens]|uniref:hypothetical protein n=1 Tax=Desulforamulus reducens TaxID=59610 RepID=UPI00059E8F9C|nr:hypothetical protein [Desulforamulus reducens]